MKTFFLSLLLFIMMIQSCFAGSSIQIYDVNKKEVIDHIVGNITKLFPTASLENVNDYGVTFTIIQPLKNVFGVDVGSQQSKLQYNVIQQGPNVTLSVNQVAMMYFNTGGQRAQQVVDPAFERYLLSDVKMYFNDYYTFGYVQTETKQDGGFVIDAVTPGYPMEEAGIKKGDVIITINGVKVTKDKRLWKYGFHDRFLPGAATFVIKRNGKEKTYVVTPRLCKSDRSLIQKDKMPPKPTAGQNESGLG